MIKPDDTYKDLERQARLKAEFLETEYGIQLVNDLKDMIDNLHLQAEAVGFVEAKALFAERAAGVRKVLDMLQTEAGMYMEGQFKEGI